MLASDWKQPQKFKAPTLRKINQKVNQKETYIYDEMTDSLQKWKTLQHQARTQVHLTQNQSLYILIRFLTKVQPCMRHMCRFTQDTPHSSIISHLPNKCRYTDDVWVTGSRTALSCFGKTPSLVRTLSYTRPRIACDTDWHCVTAHHPFVILYHQTTWMWHKHSQNDILFLW